MKNKIQVLVIDGKGSPCTRNHSKLFNHKIIGTNKRFCTFIMDCNTTEGGIRTTMCGDIL